MFAEIGLPLLAAMFLEINGLIIAVMLLAFVAAPGNRVMGRELCDDRTNRHANRTARA